MRLVYYAASDYLRTLWTLAWAKRPTIARWALDRDQRETFEIMRTCRAILVKGGGFLHAHGEARAPYYIWYQLYYLRLAHRLGVPVYILPNSFGPFRGWGVAGQIRRVLSRCHFVTARETASAEELGRLLGRDIPVYPDLGYFLKAAPRETGEAICRSAGIPLEDRRCAVVTVRPWRFPGEANSSQKYERYLDAMAELVRHMANTGVHPVLSAHVLGPSAHENDNLAIDDLAPRLEGIDWTRLDYPGDCSELKAVYGLMDYVVGTRFHSVIFAQGMGVPSLAIAYGGNKATGIMNDIGLSEFVVPIEQVNGPDLCRRFDRLVEQADEVRAILKAWLAQAGEQRRALIEALRSDLGEGDAALEVTPADIHPTVLATG